MKESQPRSIDSSASLPEIGDTLINQWLDLFEQRWEPSGQQLRQVALESGLVAMPLALAELVRVDIDRRYQGGQPVELEDYFREYPSLQEGQAAMGIAFEDYRARRSRGLPCFQDRWTFIAAVHQQPWYLELAPAVSPVRSQPLEPEVGQQFGDFQLICLLGTGAFSRVYLATQLSLAARYVALKVTRRMLSESANLAQLQHTGIVPLYSVHRVGQYTVLCMPYSGSTTLADWLDGTVTGQTKLVRASNRTSDARSRDGQSLIETVAAKQAQLERDTAIASHVTNTTGVATSHTENDLRRPPSRVTPENSSALALLQRLGKLTNYDLALWLGTRLASALAHAHARGIVHGDLKPANILIRTDGEPALIDFNLSRNWEANDCAYIGGTLPYMAPEQFQALLGRKIDISYASDIYSLGLILYEVLIGRAAFAPPATMAECDLLAAIDYRRSHTPILTDASLTPGLKSILGKCLAFSAHERYATAQQLFDDLDAQRRYLPLVHAREPWSARAVKISRRYPRAFSTGVVASIATFVCVVIAWIGIGAWQRAETLSAERFAAQYLSQLHAALPQVFDQTPQSTLPEVLQTVLHRHSLALANPQFSWLDSEKLQRLRRAEYEQCLSAAMILLEKSSASGSMANDTAQQLLAYCEQQSQQFGWSSLPRKLLDALDATRKPVNDAAGDLAVQPSSLVDSLPTNTTATEQLLLARLTLSSGQPGQTLQRLKGLELADDWKLLYWLTTGAAEMQLGEARAASLSFTLAIQAAPQCGEGYRQRAQALAAISDWSAAKIDCDAAIQCDARWQLQSAATFVQRALILERLEQYEAAIGDIDTALSLGEESTRLYFIRSRLNRAAGNLTAAETDQQLAAERQPICAADWIARALARVEQTPEAALADLQAAQKLQPDSPSVLQNLAYVYSEYLDNPRQALVMLDRLLDLHPDNQEARGGRCVLLARLQETQRALEDLAYLRTQISNPLPVTLYQMGCAHALLVPVRPASRREALKLLMQALSVGYGHDLLATDADLTALGEDPEFKKLVDLSRLHQR